MSFTKQYHFIPSSSHILKCNFVWALENFHHGLSSTMIYERGFAVQQIWSHNEIIAATICHNYQLSYDDFSQLFYINNCVWQMQRIWTNLSG